MKKTLLVIVTILSLAAFLAAQTNTFCASNLACTISGTWTHSAQIVSTVSTGTAPLSIASTTVVPNLNVQLHNGLTAPASAIVGISDSQTLTNKTLTSPIITTPTINSVSVPNPVAQVGTQNSASTNFGSNLAAQTVVASFPTTTLVNLSANFVQSVVGVGCGAGSNQVTATFSFTAPGGTTQTSVTASFSISANGVLDNGNTPSIATGSPFIMKTGTSLTYTTSSTLASAGCSTIPQYTVYAKAFF